MSGSFDEVMKERAGELKSVSFPSDSLTLRGLRDGARGDWELMGVIVHNVVLKETEVASDILRRPGSSSTEEDRIAAILHEAKTKELADLYVEIGLAAGHHEAGQLVERLEAAVRAAQREQRPGL